MAKGHGGARRGAGRKPKRVAFARPIRAAEKRIADALPELAGKLLEMARGGAPRVEERYEPAGMVTLELVHVDDKGKATKGHRLAFPDLEPDALVLVERKVITFAPDIRAIAYALDRIMGKPDVEIEEKEAEDPTEGDYVLDLGGGPVAPDPG